MKVLFYTLGCKVNQYDTGSLTEGFVRRGFTVAQKGEIPDVVVVNTCTVTAESDRKGRQAIRRFARQYPRAIITVTGCMPQAVAQKAEELTAAHIVVGNAMNFKLPDLVLQYSRTRERIVQIRSHEDTISPDDICSASFEGRERAFVKIEDGCNRFCSYCLIPYARGRVRSKPLDMLKAELQTLAASGYKEVVLAGINLTAYGQDLDCDLCDAVALAQNTKGICRVRLGSMEPDQFTPAMIERLAGYNKLCPQFHLSLQSGCDTVLARMNRHYDTGFYRELVYRLRSQFPGCAITTDIMCGFPGETEEEFAQTLAFIQEIEFAKIHPFVYSPREGTPAAAMKEQVPPAVKSRRADALNQAARNAAGNFMKKQVGTVQPVLFEQSKTGGFYMGHTPHYLPVQAASKEDLTGQIRPVFIREAGEEVCLGNLTRS